MQRRVLSLAIGLLVVFTVLSPAQASPPPLQLPMRGNVEVKGYLPGEGDHTQGRDYWAVDLFSDNPAVYPIAPGKVAFADWNCQTVSGQPPCYGYVVAIDHGNGIYSIYTHLASSGLPTFAQDVAYNTQIGTMSDSGCSGCGVHLHFAVHQGPAGLTGTDALWGANTPVNVWDPSNSWRIPGLPWPYARGAIKSLGDIGGAVKVSGNGAVVSGASVTFTGGGTTKTTTTDSNGRYYFPNVPAGGARITASKSDLGSASVDVTVQAGNITQAPDIFLGARTKSFTNPLWPGWWAVISACGSGNVPVKLDGNILSPTEAKRWTRWVGRGSHTLEWTGTSINVDYAWWPISPACADEPPPPPPPPPPGDPQPTPGATPPPQAYVSSATFIADVTYPDGSVLSPGQSFNKTWRLKNTGTSTWNGFTLNFINGNQMGGPPSVAVPTTAPGQTVDITVPLVAPSSNGSYQGNWQLKDNQRVNVSGGKVWVAITVPSITPPSASSHIAAFSADPPSPSSANTVRIYARVNWWAQFRAMRVKVDNQVIGESSATEQAFNWDTTTASRGEHSVVLEVADQSDTSWTRPEQRATTYTSQGTPAPANHAPNRPSPISPYDWYVYYSGNTAQLCAQANGDPDDGDTITRYYFDIYDSPQTWNSGWIESNCATTGALGPYNYQWRVQVKDSRGGVSDWSDTWHFTLVNPNLSISELYFQPQDSYSEQVKIRACTTGQGGIGITMRVDVNDANDGSGNGTWHRIKEQGSPCFNENDAPIWLTLRERDGAEFGDGPHRVRVQAHGNNAGWDGAASREEVYTLPHRRPAGPRLLAPVPASGNTREAIYLNSRTITLTWEPTLRTSNYTLHIGTNPSPKDDPSPVFRQTFGSSVTQYAVTFSQDYPTLYWQVTASNDVGTNASGDQLFGIDRVAPSSTVQALPSTTYESVFQVNWSGSDNRAGIRSYDIQYMDSGRGAWTDWLISIPVTYALFIGEPGHIYYFRSRATDNANNTGSYPASADTFTKVDPAARPPTPWWNSAYSGKRNITILNNMPSITMPTGYPVRLHFDSATTPTASDLYNASQSSPKCNDLRIIYNDTTELDRLVETCSSSMIDIRFRTQVSIPGGASDNTSHQLYYGNASPGAPPANQLNVWPPPNDGNTVGLWYLSEGSGSTSADLSGRGLSIPSPSPLTSPATPLDR